MPRSRWLFQTCLVGVLGGAVLGSTIALSQRDYSFFDPLIDIKTIISQRYVEPPDEQAMQLAAINGMVESLGDAHTVYIPPSGGREFTKDLTGDFVGIGVQIHSRAGWVTVVTPLEDSPAFKAGVMPDDRIVEVEGTSTEGLSTLEVVDLLSGDPGTPVSFTVERDGQRIPITITRQRIISRTVKGLHWQGGPAPAAGAPAALPEAGSWSFLLDPQRKIAYLRLTQFTPTSADEIAEALRTIGAERAELGGLILDLRWNPGGVLYDAVQIADLFLEEGVIVSTRGRAHREEVARATRRGTLPVFPIALLINGQSASASEVLAGALVEHGRAIAVGTRTFGKGSVQSVIPLPSNKGGQLKITEQRYYLPSGRSIQRDDKSAEWGVDPSDGFYVPLTAEEEGELLQARRREEIIRAPGAQARESDWSDPDWIVSYLKDKQLAAALKAVQLRAESGRWEPTGEPAPGAGQLALADLRQAELLRERLFRELSRLERRIESLASAAGPVTDPPAFDLWPDDLDLTGGRLEVRDAEGNLVTRLRITGNNLERWLIDADVKPVEEPGGEEH